MYCSVSMQNCQALMIFYQNTKNLVIVLVMIFYTFFSKTVFLQLSQIIANTHKIYQILTSYVLFSFHVKFSSFGKKFIYQNVKEFSHCVHYLHILEERFFPVTVPNLLEALIKPTRYWTSMYCSVSRQNQVRFKAHEIHTYIHTYIYIYIYIYNHNNITYS